MNKDLTVGKPSSVLWKFCLPLFGSIVFQQLYNIADSLVAGKFIGEEALAAVGNSYEITLIFIAFAFGSNIGCSVVVSKLFGAKKFNELKTSVYTALIAFGVLCATIMVLGFLFSSKLLTLINTPENVFDDSLLYLKIYIIGLPFVFYYNVATGIFSALGDSKTPFIFLACSSVSNIAMDIFFVTVFDMGVSGVAWATFLCQGVSCILALTFVILRLKKIQSDGKVKIFSFRLLKDISLIAIPSILQQSFVSVGNIIIQGIINGFGSGVMAGYSASVKLNNLVITSLVTFANGISNFTAQNAGANKFQRVRDGLKAGVKMVWTVLVPFVVLYCVIPQYLIKIFLDDPSPFALKSGTEFLRIVAPFYFVISFKLCLESVLRGTGRMKEFMISTFTDLLLRVVLAYFLSIPFGSTGIWIAWPIGWLAATALSIVFYRIRRKTLSPGTAED